MKESSLIVKDILKPHKIIETHISYLFITDLFVYKLKKPVDLGFLDYISLENRKKYCILENELNKRFCDNIYEGVLQIVEIESGYKIISIDNDLPQNATVIEYLVKMKKIDDSMFLHNLIENNKIDKDSIFRLGTFIADKLKNLPLASKEHGGYFAIKYNIEENFDQTSRFVQHYLDGKVYEYIRNETMKFLNDNEELFTTRLNEGFVKDGHGDIRVEHIFINNDETGIIDCIEFNERFRANDVVCDFVFLCMELDQRGYINLSDHLLEGFLSVFSDKDTRRLINFYKCYRAFVRAKVGCLFLEQKDQNWSLYESKKKEIEKLLYLSFSYAFNMNNMRTIVFYGLMGSGKSRNAKAFAECFGASYFNTDICRKSTLNIPSYERHYVDFGTGIYSDDITLRVYDKLGIHVVGKNNLCRFSVVDGSFSKKSHLNSFLNNKDINIIKIKCVASIDEIKKRLMKREKNKSISDGRVSILSHQISTFEDIKPHIILNTESSIDSHALELAHNLIDLERGSPQD